MSLTRQMRLAFAPLLIATGPVLWLARRPQILQTEGSQLMPKDIPWRTRYNLVKP